MVSVFTQIAVTVVAWFILMFICTNLLGFFVRGFVSDAELEKIAAGNDVLTNDLRSSQAGSKVATVVIFLIMIAFLVVLYRFWNIVLVVGALMLLLSRLPDLIWEIRHGKKLQSVDMARPRFYLLSTALSWLSLPVVWYALYRL